jgi:hypothetical protein
MLLHRYTNDKSDEEFASGSLKVSSSAKSAKKGTANQA